MPLTVEKGSNKVGLSAGAQVSRRRLRVCMPVYSFYESDTRVLQYATALAKRGDIVDVIALKRRDAQPGLEVVDGVNVHRVQTRTVNEKGLFAYGSRILRFLVRSALLVREKHREQPYDLVHVHNVPDFLVFSAWFAKRHRVPVILDIHDLLPEFYASKFQTKHDSFLFRFLVRIERWSASFADHVIVANHLWRDRFAERSCRQEKCSVIRNYPDPEIFVPQTATATRNQNKFILLYPGSLNWHQGLDVAIRAFARIAKQIPDAEFHIYGEGPAKSSLIKMSAELGVANQVIFHDFLPSHEVARIMGKADLAIEPKRATSSFGNEALSTKILEFMTLGVPVVASKTRIHAFYYDDSIIRYYEQDDEAQLAAQILVLKNQPELRRRIARNAREYANVHNWSARKFEYLQLADSLTHSFSSTPSTK